MTALKNTVPDLLTPILRHYAFKFHLDLDDLRQDIELKILIKKDRFRYMEGGTYKSWLNTVVHNHCLDQKRNKHNRTHFSTIEDHHSFSHVDYDSRQYIASCFWRVRARWPRRRRVNTRILWMVMVGYSYNDITAELQVSENTWKSHLHRMREFLRESR